MDKNLFLAIALSLLVYVGWFGFVEKRLAKNAPAAASASATPAVPNPNPVTAPAPVGLASGSSQSLTPSGNPLASMDRQTIERQSFMMTLGKAQARVHPRGAGLVSLQYREPLGTVELVKDPQPGLLAAFHELSFSQDKKNPARFSARKPDGLEVFKEFVAPADETSLPKLVITLRNTSGKSVDTGAWKLTVGPGLGTILTEEKENAKLTRALALTPGTSGLNGKIDTLKTGAAHPGPYRWVGIDNRYFLAALLPKAGDFTVSSSDPAAVDLIAPSQTLSAGKTQTFEVPYYLGEKGHTWLSRYNLGLERSIDFGFFAQLGRFILKALDRIQDVTGNWGWSIILLTIALQILLFPLTYKSLKAQAAMKRLQPEIARLQQRHAKDPQKLNAEMMDMYKKNGANPLGGCLPMVLQMPVFIALFNTLRNAWELHGAGWMFWVKDLSAKDPYYVLPLVMGALMFFQNKLNPPSTDPTQQQMMTWMPIVFTFMFLNFPAGLVLYWLTNSVANFTAQVALKSHFDKQ